MLRTTSCLITALLCSACAKPQTQVLEPYALADGKMFQDVITIGADKNGTAPVVTQVKTFQLRTGYKGAGTQPTRPVATASGSGSGLVSTLSGSLVSTAIPAATGLIIAKKGWNRTTVNNSNNNSNENRNSTTNNVSNTNNASNVNTNTNNNINENNNANINQ